MNEEGLGLESRYLDRISEDGLEAYLMRNSLTAGNFKDSEDSVEKEKRSIYEYLEERKINHGIMENAIDWMAENPGFYEEVLIAVGEPCKNGTDGYYKYSFDINPDKKPIILEDGSVDYNTLGRMELCSEGALLAVYYPAVLGEDGRDVYGGSIVARAPKELKELKGKGFKRSDSGLEYLSAYEGKVELIDGKLRVSRLYTVEGNVDAVTGGINFKGDVLVKGSVYSDVTIEATGNITVNGHVEIATLIAGGEVLLKAGMQGAGKGSVRAKGNVSANFFEQTHIIAGGSVNANVILNCDIDADVEVAVSGKRGAIVGGVTRAVEKITAMSIGNKAETATKVYAGVHLNFQSVLTGIDETIEKNQNELDDIKRDLGRIMDKLAKKENLLMNERKMEMVREKIVHESAIREQKNRKSRLLDLRERSLDAEILVQGRLYPRVTVMINGASQVLAGECSNVTLKKRTGEVHIYSNTLFG